jgi:hypothetical protein
MIAVAIFLGLYSVIRYPGYLVLAIVVVAALAGG